MEKEKFVNIQNKLPNAVSYYSENMEDVMMFFGPKHNPFYADYASSKKYLKELIARDVNLLAHCDAKKFEETVSDQKYLYLKDKYTEKEAMIQYKQVKSLELEYLLYVNYALELLHNENLFDVNPPFTDKVTKYVYKHREANLDKYKNLLTYYSQGLKKNSIFVDEDRTIKNIIKDNFGNSMCAIEPMLLDSKTQNKLAYGTKKYPLTENAHHTEKDNYDYYEKYYVGKYKGQYVLFSEVVRITKKQKNKKQGFSYQLNVVLNGDPNKNRMLYRIDYNTKANHINKIEGRSINASNTEVNLDELRHKDVKVCHIHTPNNRYVTVFPNYTHSCDAKAYDFKFKNYDQFVDFNRNLIKTEENVLVAKHYKDSLKTKQTALKIFLKDFRDDCLKNEQKNEK